MLNTIIAGAFVLGVVVIVHEFGHFIVAKLCGIYVKTFSIGFGKKLIGRRFGETVYVLSVLPFGGYVKFAGETYLEGDDAPVEEEPAEPARGRFAETPDREIPRARYFTAQPRWKRAAVLLAGPFMNYVLAILLYVGVLSALGIHVAPTTRVGDVVVESPAADAGIAPGDTILSIEGTPVKDWYDVETMLVEGEPGPREMVLRKDGVSRSATITPEHEGGRVSIGLSPFVSSRIGIVQKGEPAERAGIQPGSTIEAINDTVVTTYDDVRRIVNGAPGRPLYVRWSFEGIAYADTVIPEAREVLAPGSTSEFVTVGLIGIGGYSERRPQPLGTAIKNGFAMANGMIAQILDYLRQLFAGRMDVKTLGGPILITQMAGDVANWGFEALLLFLAFFNINLCVFNLLPVVPFDGGHLAILGIESIMRRPINRRLREWITQGGFILIILLMAFVIVLDLTRCTGSTPGGF